MSDQHDERPPTKRIVEREVEPGEETPNYRVLETIADVEDVDETELPPLYPRIDHILDELFSEPPVPESQIEISFSYHGYRVRITQEGVVSLRKLEDDLDAAVE
ncbi:HalOD1 output domain-containing protein [Haloarcula litorea]|uniref:HalOD1 output domain-containing protein n=1 Tax=Haloarcula litorea TaxID=3032579 RepID=UPI0023E894EB|nr:HalOD1 output domain-containing protein [Halomicroarcula sp. GDY20]